LIGPVCSKEFFGILGKNTKWDHNQSFDTEEKAFSSVSIHFIPAYRREREISSNCARKQLSTDLQPGDIRGIIHSHSNWSDGSGTLEQMARLVSIRDLNTLSSVIQQERILCQRTKGRSIMEQHRLIEELNNKLAPFVIFKSIESDILNDVPLTIRMISCPHLIW